MTDPSLDASLTNKSQFSSVNPSIHPSTHPSIRPQARATQWPTSPTWWPSCTSASPAQVRRRNRRTGTAGCLCNTSQTQSCNLNSTYAPPQITSPPKSNPPHPSKPLQSTAAWSATGFVPAITQDRALFVREQHDGMYRPTIYLIWKVVDELTLQMLISWGAVRFGLLLVGLAGVGCGEVGLSYVISPHLMMAVQLLRLLISPLLKTTASATIHPTKKQKTERDAVLRLPDAGQLPLLPGLHVCRHDERDR